ncbi:MAG: shikimate dehydrogenase [Saprospiraceae bacterium]|nr:shikimate dehydrogenase [Saprospiraceae bacterium]MCB9325560.1 shikimate dehydrogenase [Lewinellaceae bacterium]
MHKDIDSFQRLFGLIGYPISHSFSKKYFTEKFQKESIENCFYELFPLEHIDLLPSLIQAHNHLEGLNVTIPYKQLVMPFLDEIAPSAREVGAVNTIRIKNGKLHGYNTDIYGFEHSLLKLLNSGPVQPKKALVLGTGGAASAVIYVLNKLKIGYKTVSRTADKGNLVYQDLNAKIMQAYKLIINTTPLGMSPNINNLPLIPYTSIGTEHFLFDLVYNPEETAFLKTGKFAGAATSNGMEMLFLQAEKAWEIWNL